MLGRLRRIYLTHFSRPACDRELYRVAATGVIRRVLAIGLGSPERWLRVLELAQAQLPGTRLEFAATDVFEDRTAAMTTGLTLKETYRRFSPLARLRLAPGEPYEALRGCANAWGEFDLAVIAHGIDANSLARAWLYVPRMLHSKTRVFWERSSEGGAPQLNEVTRSEIDRLARPSRTRRAA